ncbi:MAG: glutamate racemase [Rubrivivax sp.]|nr:MAG: glutamate racemase [Rubrivivax sp.]
MGNRAPIGVFDSGLGGLAVLRSMREAMASEDFIYMADSAYAPYGDRSPEWILHRSAAICEFLLQEGAKALVVACNTATTVAVRALRERFSPVPIVAIEPAVKPAAALTRSGVVGVMATSRTIGSAQFAHLREQYGRGLSILGQACPGLADLVEAGRFDDDELHQQVAHYVEPLIARGADTLVLGCTHYTFLRPIIQSVGGPAVTIVDPAIAVANEVVRRLREAQLLSDARGRGHTMFFTSGRPVRVGAVLERLWPPGGVVYRAPGLAGGD